MVRIAAGRMERRRLRRPIFLVAICFTVGLGIAGAVAGAAMMAKMPRDPVVRSLWLHVAPRTQTVAPGGSATYAVRVESGRGGPNGLSGRTRLSVEGRISQIANSSFSPRSTVVPRGASHRPSQLTIQTSAATTPGTYRFLVRARRPHDHGRTTVILVVSAVAPTPTSPAPGAPAQPAPGAPPPAPGAPAPVPPVLTAPDAFTISGNLPGLLEPGSDAPLDLSLANLERVDISITGLTVRVDAVRAPHADALHPCTLADFAVAQFSGAPGFILRASSTATLAELGFPEAQWPRVAMVESGTNQNGCQSASLQLGFVGAATESSP